MGDNEVIPKGCPFCENPEPYVEDDGTYFWVRCDFCQGEGPMTDLRIQAIKIWEGKDKYR